jgi:hypothetical protein
MFPTPAAPPTIKAAFRNEAIMAERNPVYLPDIASDTIDYKPLSLLAVAGLVAAILYAVILVVSALVALFKGEPFFLANGLLAIPIAGAALSSLALWQINNSEGTRAGTKLAKWGLGVSLIAGLGYFTYQTFTGLAIIQQANRFLMEKDVDSGFFPRLQGSDIDVKRAFLFTLSANERGNARPEDSQGMERFDLPSQQGPKGRLTMVLESTLVRAIRSATPGTVKVEPGGVKDWTYENGAYRIIRTYRISTDEGVWEIPLVVTSVEALAEGDKRQWKVEWAFANPIAPSRTELGIKKYGLRQKAHEFLTDPKVGWFTYLARGRQLDVYLGWKLPADRKELRERYAALHAGTPLAAAAGPAARPLVPLIEEKLAQKMLPGYLPLSKVADYFDMNGLRVIDPAYVAKVKEAAKQALAPDKLGSLLTQLKVLPNDLAPCEFKDGQVEVTHQFEIMVPLFEARNRLDVLVMGKVVVAASGTLEPNAPNADQEWRLLRCELVRAVPMSPKQLGP